MKFCNCNQSTGTCNPYSATFVPTKTDQDGYCLSCEHVAVLNKPERAPRAKATWKDNYDCMIWIDENLDITQRSYIYSELQLTKQNQRLAND